MKPAIVRAWPWAAALAALADCTREAGEGEAEAESEAEAEAEGEGESEAEAESEGECRPDEICNDVDDDCDGEIDEGDTCAECLLCIDERCGDLIAICRDADCGGGMSGTPCGDILGCAADCPSYDTACIDACDDAGCVRSVEAWGMLLDCMVESCAALCTGGGG